LNPTTVYPDSAGAADTEAARRYDGYLNRWFLDPLAGRGYPADMLALYDGDGPPVESGDLAAIATPTDFLGVNYYAPTYVRDAPSEPPLRARAVVRPELPTTAMGWPVEPRALTDLLRRIHEEYGGGPIYIAENGAAYGDPAPLDGFVADLERLRYVQSHLAAVHDAITAGVPVRGFFAWSLMDNFEWAEGYAKRFGLVHVDYATQRRTVKASGHWYSRATRANGFETESGSA
jgi:beta-glucosidase